MNTCEYVNSCAGFASRERYGTSSKGGTKLRKVLD
jgi:hypothetical protein